MVGYSESVAINKSYATGSVSAPDAGGLAAYFSYGAINESYASGPVTGTSYPGGLIFSYVGGSGFKILGKDYIPGIYNSFAAGSVTNTTGTFGLIGKFNAA